MNLSDYCGHFAAFDESTGLLGGNSNMRRDYLRNTFPRRKTDDNLFSYFIPWVLYQYRKLQYIVL